MEYTDQVGTIVKKGDILKYCEGNSNRYGSALHEVVEHQNQLCGVHRVGFPFWTLDMKHHPMALKCYCIKPDTKMLDALVIGNVKTNPEMLTVEYAAIIFPEIPNECS